MENFVNILRQVQLFNGIDDNDILPLLTCLSARIEVYNKNDIIFAIGQQTDCAGIVLSGRIRIEKDDYFGNKSIVSTVLPGQLFAESFACCELENQLINVVAAEPSRILLINCNKLITTCSKSCPFHSKLIYNMLEILAKKNLLLNQKIEFLSKRTTREKLLAYLSYESSKSHSNFFSIPFSRQELADFLYVDRSAMSHELCKLRDDGIVEFYKNQFKLL